MNSRLILAALAATAAFSTYAHEIPPHVHDHSEEGYNAEAGFVSDVDIESRLWNPRGKSLEEIARRAAWLAEQYDLQRTPEQRARADEVRKKYADAVAINSLMPSAVGIIGNTHEHFTKAVIRNRDAGMTLTSGTVYAFPDAIAEEDTAYTIIEKSDVVIREQGLIKVDTTADIRNAKTAGNMAVMYNAQGADYVAEDLEMHAEKSYDGGIRTINFVYNSNNMLAGGGSTNDRGLTDLGREWVKVAQGANLVIDVSHSSDQTAIEAAAIATKPIIASHSNAQGLHDVGRNISDEAIKAVAGTGGVICPVGAGLFLNAEGDAAPERFVEHILYISDLVGRDKVCFATDYVHNILAYLERDIPNVEIYPPELGFGAPTQNIAPENIWDVAAILEDEHGWSEEEIRGVLGENLMRVYEANWAN
jgi:microsomal dipeptidase-like Zn-dependent dipeptidase